MQHAKWEKTTYSPESANKTLLEHFQRSSGISKNWMMRNLLGKQPRAELTRDDLEYAKYLLDKKVVIGLTDHMAESLQRFERYFGWSNTKKTFWPACYAKFGNQQGRNAFHHPTVEPGSPEWDAIAQHYEWDLQLYQHAVDLFHCRGNSK